MILESNVKITYSVGRCVIPCAFLEKVSNIHFLVGKCILFKKKMFTIFILGLNVTVTSQSYVTILAYLSHESGVL